MLHVGLWEFSVSDRIYEKCDCKHKIEIEPMSENGDTSEFFKALPFSFTLKKPICLALPLI